VEENDNDVADDDKKEHTFARSLKTIGIGGAPACEAAPAIIILEVIYKVEIDR
jgi:hypothetical protein